MSSFEEEAFARAQQMHRRSQSGGTRQNVPPKCHNPEPKPEPKQEPTTKQKPEPTPVKSQNSKRSESLDGIFQDREHSLLLILLVLRLRACPVRKPEFRRASGFCVCIIVCATIEFFGFSRILLFIVFLEFAS